MCLNNKEERLVGGNVTNVSRLGNTVRRTYNQENENVHQLLVYLEKKGYEYSPRYLGMDEKGREILSFIEGEAGHNPIKAYMRSDTVLVEIAKMLRLYHDANIGFKADKTWEPLDNTPEPYEVICHNDFAMYNIIFRNEKPVGIIDFDVAAPGPRLWDIVYTLYTCVPLSRFQFSEYEGKIPYESSKHASEIKRRIALFFESYGIDMDKEFIRFVVLRLEGLCQTISRKANEGDKAFQKMLDEGHVAHYEEEIQFIKKRGSEWI